MRNPERIATFANTLQEYWKTVGIDLRFWQVFSALLTDYAEKKELTGSFDPFFVEEAEWISTMKFGIAKRTPKE